jgi:hypothetical protein
LRTNRQIEDAAIGWVMELERLAGRHPIDRRYEATFAGDIWSPPLTIEVKAVGGDARGWGVPLELAQFEAAKSDPNFVLDLVDNLAQGDATLFRHRRFEGPALHALISAARARTYFEVPVPVGVFDTTPAHQALSSGPVPLADRRPAWAVPLVPTRMSATPVTTDAGLVLVATATVAYQRWPGPKLTWQETYGKTPLVGADGLRTCAEVAIVDALRADGYDAWWIDTFGQAPAFWRGSIIAVDLLPPHVRERFEAVDCHIGDVKRSGRWDIVAWRADKVVVLESKGAGDAIRPGQARWLAASILTGAFSADAFGIVNYSVRS